jgi:hypothetical protein
MTRTIPLTRLRKRPLGRYRYVRLRWRVLFAVVDLIGGLAMSVLRATAAVFRHQPRRRAESPRTILIIQLDHLGDAVISTVLFRALRRRISAHR